MQNILKNLIKTKKYIQIIDLKHQIKFLYLLFSIAIYDFENFSS